MESEQRVVLFVCSSGGHLDQLLCLLPPPPETKIVFATFLKPDSVSKVDGYRSYGLFWPTNRSLSKLILNCWVALKVILIERPTVIVSSGAAAAVPFFYLGKLIGRPTTVFIECVDRIELATLTAKLVRPVTDRFVVQWPSQLKTWPRREEFGRSR